MQIIVYLHSVESNEAFITTKKNMSYLQEISESFDVGHDLQNYMIQSGCGLLEAATAYAAEDESFRQNKHSLEELTNAYRKAMTVSGTWLRNMVNEGNEAVTYVDDITSQEYDDVRLYEFDGFFYVVSIYDNEETIQGSGETKETALKNASKSI